MLDYIGKEIVVRFDGITVKGILQSDKKDRIILIDNENKKEVVIVKNKISMWISDVVEHKEETKEIPSEKPKEETPQAVVKKLPIAVLACANQSEACSGVRYLRVLLARSKADIGTEDYNQFMSDCPKRSTTCKCGCLGMLEDLKPEMITEMLDGLLLGEYPKRSRGRPKKHEDEQ